MVLHDHGLIVGVIFEFGSDFLAQSLTSRDVVRSEPDRSADAFCLGNDVGVRNLVRDTERYECGRMRVDHCGHLRTHFVNRLVEREFRGRFVRSDHRTVRFYADDVFRGQRTLVHCSRRDPDVTVFVLDRNVTARGGRHSAPVNATDHDRNLVGGVHQLSV